MTSFPRKATEEVVQESTAKPRKDEEVMGSHQREFTKGKSCLADLRVFSVEVTSFVEEERAVAGVYLGFFVKPLTLSPLACSWRSRESMGCVRGQRGGLQSG